MTMMRAAVAAREKHGVPVMGFDLAGEEAGYPAGHHYAAYEEAHRHFIRKTVHAGEAYGPESIYEAIARCHAERIGHGTFLLYGNSDGVVVGYTWSLLGTSMTNYVPQATSTTKGNHLVIGRLSY